MMLKTWFIWLTTAHVVIEACDNDVKICVPDPVKCPSSAKCLELYWTEMPPYCYIEREDGEGPVQGIIIDVTRKLLSRCCEDCWSINETRPVDFAEFYHYQPEMASLVLPYTISSTDQYYYEGYVPILKAPSSTYVRKKQSWKVQSLKLMTTIFKAWPVLVMALLLSVISGVFIWFLETWFNPDQFPRTFYRGTWEGFWWAFVSMTTVGYGDRAPRSFLGRTFAIFWIMIGICICSIFTATLTSALTSNAFKEEKTINGAKVGVLRDSMEAMVGIQNQADVIHYNTSKEVWESLVTGEVEGILLDYYYSLVILDEMNEGDFEIAQVIKIKDWSYGVLLLSKELAKCMRDVYNKEYANILFGVISNELHGFEQLFEPKAPGRLSGVFDPDGTMFQTVTLVCGVCTLCLFVLGLFWDLRRNKWLWKKKIDSVPAASDIRRLETMESEIISEVQKVFVSWKDKLVETNGGHPLVVMDAEQKR